MSESIGGNNPFDGFRLASIDEMFYPTPRDRVEDPAPTALQPGDLVGILVGPATGAMGVVLVERNGNYRDSEPYCSKESIGVQVIQTMDIDDILLEKLTEMGVPTDGDAMAERVTRWFDGVDQLELLYRTEPKAA